MLLSGTALAESLDGRVVRVLGGDTIEVQAKGKSVHRVRLAGINAPEKGQPFSDLSRENLSELVAGKTVTVEWRKRDRAKRLVGKVLLGSQDVSLAQVKGGLAWHFMESETELSPQDRLTYRSAEARSRSGRFGLWKDANPVAP